MALQYAQNLDTILREDPSFHHIHLSWSRCGKPEWHLYMQKAIAMNNTDCQHAAVTYVYRSIPFSCNFLTAYSKAESNVGNKHSATENHE